MKQTTEKYHKLSDEYDQPRIRSIIDIPGAIKRLGELTTRNAQVRITPHMSPAQLTAAYEEKAKLAFEAGLHYKQTLAKNVDEWEDAPRTIMAKWMGFEAGEVERPNIRALEAGDYTDPNNQFGILNGTLVMQRTLPLFAYDFPEVGALYLDASGEPGYLNQESTSHIISVPAVQKYNSALDANGRPIGFVTVSPAQSLDVPITLTDYVAVPIVIGQGTLGATNRNLFNEQAPAGLKAIVGYWINMIMNLISPANFSAYAQVNGGYVPIAYAAYSRGIQDWSMTDLDKLSAIFTQNKVPRRNRGILLNPQYYAKLRSDPRLEFFFAASKGDPMLTEQTLPQGLSGFFPYEAPYLPATVPFFPFHKAGIVLKQRLPSDFVSALKLGNNQVPGSVTTVTDPDSKLSVALVQRVDLVGNYAEWRPETMLGAGLGDIRGGLCGSM